MSSSREEARIKRRARVRKKISGTSDRPRLSVFRSVKHLYAQLIDDQQGRTLFGFSTRDKGFRKACVGNVKEAQAFGKAFAERAKEKSFGPVVFDRAGYRYHGRLKAFADGARQGGLKF